MIVIEASAMVDALVGQPADPTLLALLADADLHAPALLDYEVASALRGHALAGRLSGQRLADAIEDFGGMRIERYPLGSMMSGVLHLKDNFTAYDAAYVLLARTLDAPLVTADAKLTGARSLGIDVQVLRRGS